MARPASDGRQAVGIWSYAVSCVIDKVEYAANFFDEFIYCLFEPGGRATRAVGHDAESALREEIKAYIDSLIEGTDERLDRKFNERAGRLEGENSMLKDLVEKLAREKDGLQEDLDRLEAEYGMFRAEQDGKARRCAQVFEEQSRQIDGLKGQVSDMEEANRALSSDKADAARQLGEMEAEARELRKVAAFRYGFQEAQAVIDTGLYPIMNNRDRLYMLFSWLRKANESEVSRDYMDRVIGMLADAGGVHKKVRTRALDRMLDGDPADALSILGGSLG